MTARPAISVWNFEKPNEITGSVALPGVFTAPIRLDIVNFVFSNINRNRRQAHGVDPKAGHKHSAESWGTGRAVARIPRVSGSGTNRSGQGAFGNQCRKGRMFAPVKVWRRWHRRVNVTQKRHAVSAAVAATAVVPLVQARGHRINGISELPLVFNNAVENIERTKDAVAWLTRIGAFADVERVIDARTLRSGTGKMRNNRYTSRTGPLVIIGTENVKLSQALRNVPGVTVANVNRLNLLELAPGGQLGRFVIWTESAFRALNAVFGTQRYGATEKEGYHLQRSILTTPDIAKIINSNEVQSKLNNAGTNKIAHFIQKKNPLSNQRFMDRLNPFAAVRRTQAKAQNEAGRKAREEAKKAKRGASKSLSKDQKTARNKNRSNSARFYNDAVKRMTEVAQRDITTENGWKKEDLEALGRK
jgi:large subunit ribosomal protein L4e